MFNWWKLSFCVAPYLVFAVEWMLMWAALRGHAKRMIVPLTLFGFLAASKFIGVHFFGGNAINTELPVWPLFAWDWMESVVWIGLPVGLCAAICAWLLRRFHRNRPTNVFVMWMAIGVSMALAAYGMWEGMRIPSVAEREVEFGDLPQAFDGYRIAHISDIHCSSAARRGKIAGIVERVNVAKPDLVCITGDFVDGFPPEREHDLEPLKGLCAKDGVLGCTGNHEKYWRIARWEPYFKTWGVRMLRNEWTAIERGSDRLIVGG